MFYTLHPNTHYLKRNLPLLNNFNQNEFDIIVLIWLCTGRLKNSVRSTRSSLIGKLKIFLHYAL